MTLAIANRQISRNGGNPVSGPAPSIKFTVNILNPVVRCLIHGNPPRKGGEKKSKAKMFDAGIRWIKAIFVNLKFGAVLKLFGTTDAVWFTENHFDFTTFHAEFQILKISFRAC